MRKILKIFSFVIAGIVVLLAVVLFAISNGKFNSRIVDQVIKITNDQINGELNIDNLEGNIFSHFTINKVSLQQKGNELVTLDKLEIEYNIWAVLDKKIEVDSIFVKGLYVNLKQETDSLWNLQKLVPQNQDVKQDTVTSPFSWMIDVKKVKVRGLGASVLALDTNSLIPRSLNLNLSLSFAMANDSMNLNLDEFDLLTKKPSLEVKELKFKVGLIDSVFNWNNFELRLKNTNIVSRGTVTLNELGNSEFTLHASPLAFDDFRDFVPMLYGKPQVELLVSPDSPDSNSNNISNINFRLIQQKQSLTMLGQFASLMSKPSYDLTIKVDSLNGEYWTHKPEFKSNINGSVKLKGEGFDPKFLSADINISLDSSSIFEVPINDFSSKVSLNSQNYVLKGLDINTPFLFASAKGKGNFQTSNNIALSVDFKDIEKLASFFNQKNTSFEGGIRANITGSLDSLNLLSKFDISNFKYDSIKVGHIMVNSNMLFSDKNNSGNVNLNLDEASFKDFKVKNIVLESELNKYIVTNDLSFQVSDSLNGQVVSKLYLGQIPSLYLPLIKLNIYNYDLIGGSDESFIRFGTDSIEVNKLRIAHVGNDSVESALNVNGVFAFNGTERLHLEIKNLDLSQIQKFSSLPYQFSGNVNTLLDVTGTAEKPVVAGYVNVHEPEVNGFGYGSFNTFVNYADNYFKLASTLNENKLPVVSADINVPLHLSFSDSIFVNREDSLMHAILDIHDLDISKFTSYMPVKGVNAKGLLNLKIKVGNTINNPDIKGGLNLFNGALTYKKLGVDYKNIEMRSQLNNNIFSLDSLLVFSGKGNLKMDGNVEIDSLFKGELKKIDFNLKGKDFRAFNSDMLEAIINTNLSVKGDAEHSVFKGGLSVLSSTTNVDAFAKEYNSGASQDVELPLLVKAQELADEKLSEGSKYASDTIKIDHEIKKDTIPASFSDMYKNLTGQFEIEIPRNSWVKGKNMNFELAGKIKAIKEGAQIDFFGDLNIKRGYYKIYGRKLEVEQGEITLTGGALTNPIVNFTIFYKFRDAENVLRKLDLTISGRVSKPTIEFLLDDVAIDEKEAISYLMFNKSPDQLDTRQTASTNNSNMDIAKNMAIGQLSNLVKDALQSSLGLDVFEFSGKDGGTTGSVSIGKYITNNLFLSYERSFSLDKKDKVIEPEKISMEYQFYRFLFLQATNQGTNSGFDFILKWTWR